MMVSMGANLNPIFGIASIPHMGFQLGHAFGMNARELLAKNFKKLRDATPGLSAPKDIVNSGAATNGTIGGWPFPDIDRERFDRLSLRQQIEIQGVVRERIERFEGGDGGIEGVRGNGTHGR